MTRALLAFTLGVSSCTLGCHERPACQPATLAAIEAAYIAEAIQACRGYTAERCPALPTIDAKYSEQREAWIQCR